MQEYIEKLRQEELETARNLKAQYEKEYFDALNCSGLCSGMSINQASSIAADLKEHIDRLNGDIKTLEEMK